MYSTPSFYRTQTNEGPSQPQQQQQRQSMDVPNMKTSKPQPNRPIAPAAASNVMPIGPPLNTGYMHMPAFGYPQMMNPHMIGRPMQLQAPQQYSHVPFGASSAAISASAHPKGISPSLRGASLPTAAKLSGMTSHLQGQTLTLQSKTHPAVSTPTTLSRPSSPAMPIPSTSSVPSFQQQSTEHKPVEVRSPMMPDHPRRTSSPHCPSSTVQNSSAVITSVKTTLHTPSVPSHKPGQPIMLPHFVQDHSSLTASSYPPPAVSSSMQPGGNGTVVSMAISQHLPKPIQSVSVTMAPTMDKMYASHMSMIPGRPGIPQPEAIASPDISRLSGKQSGPASPVTVPQHSVVSTVPSSAHVIAASAAMQPSTVMDARMERPHPSVTITNTMLTNQMGMYPRYVFPETTGFPFSHSGFPPPIIRPLHTATTPVSSGMHILDPQGYMAVANNALRTSVAMMDSTGGQSIYGMPVPMQQPSNLQMPISSSNPNATSPRPSILRKRPSEGIRKPAVVPYNDGTSATPSDPNVSPRSDSTLSAPQSGQSSPKPPSDSGSQPSEPPQQQQQPPVVMPIPTTSKVEPPVTVQNVPEPPVQIKKEQNEIADVTTTGTTVTSSMAVATTSSSTAEKPAAVSVALPDGASPRKKPRKQNVVVTEDKYGSSVPLEEGSSDEEEKKPKPQPEDTVMDDDLKFILLKRPKISIYGGYKVNTKAAHNHFLRYSDIKIKEERKPTLQDIANQKNILHRVSGWRIHHVAAQMDDLNSIEQEVLSKLFEFRENLPKPRPGQKSKYHDELVMLDELVQGNIQRSQLVTEQLADIRKVMVKALDHRPRCVEVLQKYINKRNPKKKS
ncbi:histone deacetylase complex subunit SAP130-A-like isoform X2 [Actinia tenebrosa]|uniref:Histone deacetylase complex subunit SAP130-A-like isoform X2 n=1 Tax=Actinia tenebrosa TaxID=6105 RepID=A0A6P8HU72_ACTTE|nr:histone deacetylase complex subunit SAP130-A-like isoform X2 [Actinia tenebrosa]